ncbi:UNVERIFIED_CONTAM: 60S ribosomal protein L23a-1 [Sesamum angustifolium]|uniref:60S ribosomal protein L23a-1 n=1 Tax=Sesamum angustifolium TaxID=2727405 RepID=A0AAW2RPW0_9LAMI
MFWHHRPRLLLSQIEEHIVVARKKRNESQRFNSSAAESNKLDLLPVIRYPLATESAIKAILESNTLVFIVDKRADKKSIKDAFKNMLKTRAKKVNTLIMPDGTKKAYIMLGPDCKAMDVAKKIKIL